MKANLLPPDEPADFAPLLQKTLKRMLAGPLPVGEAIYFWIKNKTREMSVLAGPCQIVPLIDQRLREGGRRMLRIEIAQIVASAMPAAPPGQCQIKKKAGR